MRMSKVVIYAMASPGSLEDIRYVGKTVNLPKRISNHLWAKRKTHCSCWVQSLKREGKTPAFMVLEVVAKESDWRERERFWISLLGQSGRLTNLSVGGDGGLGVPVKESTRRLLSKVLRGKAPAPQTIEAAKRKLTGVPKTEEHKAKLRLSQAKFRQSEAGKVWRENLNILNRKLSTEQVLRVRSALRYRGWQADLAREFKVSPKLIQRVVSGANYSKVA